MGVISIWISFKALDWVKFLGEKVQIEKRGQLSEPWSHSVHRVWRDERANQMDKGQSEIILEAK